MNRHTIIRLACLLCLPLFAINASKAREVDPVRWDVYASPLPGDTVLVTFRAEIGGDWHLYDLGPYTDGPNATTIAFLSGEGVRSAGKPFHITPPVKAFDSIFGMNIGTFAGEALFGQKVIVEGRDSVKAEFSVEWMSCREGECLPPSGQTFIITLPPGTGEAAGSKTGGSPWGMILGAILWGFAALLTPCVFPMVPMTVSFFIKGSENKKRGRFMASLYGISIVALYTIPIAMIILLTRFIGGETITADIFNYIATHWLPNVIFFLVFMVFAASFLGAFEITLPSSIANKSDRKADKGGITGVFFMALTLVLVSFSCTGPIVGTVLIESMSGGIWRPVFTMLAFSVAFALPFTLLALFPGFLNKIPKSGSWLGSVKIVLGFLELALGLKFLSVADQTYHWGILDREVYLALWIVIFTLLGLYLIGKLTFKHETAPTHIGVTRLFLAIGVFSFVVYMIPGMWGAPLRGISGYIPPMHTQDFVCGRYDTGEEVRPADKTTSGVKYGDFLSLPHGLKGFFDYNEAIAYAQKVGKPILLDYTGHGCVNCREMEARVWSDPGVLSLMRDEFVILALYSDDKKPLPKSEWVTLPNGNILKNLGKINAYFAHHNFRVNFQPYYLILSPEGKPLGPGRGYDLSIEGFEKFLLDGIKAYRESVE